ncbi:MAG: hypothetical protein ABIY40_06295 [Rhodanobacteraceae bacterium]|nr:hypothetical protein [Pseudomonadota bacterium]
MNRSQQLVLAMAIVLPLAATPMDALAHPGHEHAATATAITRDMATTPAPSALAQTLRTLWLGHVEATRAYLFAAHDHQADKMSAAADRVVANAKQIAAAVGSFYGKPAGDRMLTLLAGHWVR